MRLSAIALLAAVHAEQKAQHSVLLHGALLERIAKLPPSHSTMEGAIREVGRQLRLRTAATSAPGLGSAAATFAPGLGALLLHLHRDCACARSSLLDAWAVNPMQQQRRSDPIFAGAGQHYGRPEVQSVCRARPASLGGAEGMQTRVFARLLAMYTDVHLIHTAMAPPDYSIADWRGCATRSLGATGIGL